jgi:hypothetical protein
VKIARHRGNKRRQREAFAQERGSDVFGGEHEVTDLYGREGTLLDIGLAAGRDFMIPQRRG